MGDYDLCVNIMGEYELWVGRQTDRQTNKQRDRHTHINTMTQPGLGAGQSENWRVPWVKNLI